MWCYWIFPGHNSAAETLVTNRMMTPTNGPVP
jgi:hypothetical protein